MSFDPPDPPTPDAAPDEKTRRRGETARSQPRALARLDRDPFEQIARSARDAIISVDHKGEVVYWNLAAEGMFGFAASEMEGQTLTRIMPERYQEAHERALQRIAKAENPQIGERLRELEGLRKDGTTFPLELSLSTWRMGGSNYFTAFLRDTTTRKKAEKELSDSDNYNRMLFDQAPIGMALCRLNGDLVDCNPAYASLVGRTPDEVLHLSYWDLTPEQYYEEEQRQLERLHSTGRYGPYEKEYLHKDGHPVPVRLNGRLLSRGGETYIWSSVEDLSSTRKVQQALEESQSVFSLFMDKLPAAVFIKDDRSRVLYANEFLITHFGLEDSQGTASCHRPSSAAFEKIRRDDRRALAEGRYETVETLTDRTGGERVFHTHKFVIPRQKGASVLLGGIAWDITDSVTASETLARSERRYREIFDAAQEGIWLLDAEARTLEVNEQMARMLGYSSFDMLDRSLLDFMDEPARAEADLRLQRPSRGVSGRFDFRFRTKDGADLWTIVSSAPMYDAQGGYVGALQMVTDITERKRAEEALRAREDQLRLILASTGEGIFGLDMRGCCTFANRACHELLGYASADDLVGKKMHELIHHTHQDGRAYPVAECPTFRSCRERLVIFAEDEPLWRADGTCFHADYQSYPMLRDGEVLGAVVSFADISERLRAEAALKQERDFAESLIETAPVIVLVLDAEGNILRFNSFLERLCGYSLAEVKGRSWFDTFLPKRDVPSIREVFAQAKSGVQTDANLNAILTRDGEERLVSWHDTTLRDLSGAVSAVLAIGHDVTEQKAKEAQLAQAQKMELVGQLTGGIAHDFNNLLTVILGNLRILANTLGHQADFVELELLDDALSAAQDGAELTQRLLAFSRQAPLRQRRVDLPDFLRRFQRFLQRTLGAEISVGLDLADEVGDLVCDSSQLESALLNLAVNARDAMAGGGRLTLHAALRTAADPDRHLTPGTFAELAVIDTGAGMTREQLTRAVEPFYTTKAAKMGTGLGLSMVYGFCEQSGGRFELESEPGIGTRATILLPLEGIAGEEIIETPAEAHQRSNGKKKGKALAVEDEARILKLAARYLQELGYEVLTAENGELALEVLRTDPGIELVFSDVVLPGSVNGNDLYRWIKEERPGLKILLTTGLQSAELHELANGKKPHIALPKPYSKEQLAAAIRDLAEG